jgi:hypothetical protein
MIIKIIPETEMEKAKVNEVEHYGVSEFFIFGNKRDEGGDLIDFHDWKGGYRYLVGSLYYFLKLISGEQKEKHNRSSEMPPKMVKYGDAGRIQMPPLQSLQFPPVNVDEDNNEPSPEDNQQQ